MYSCAILYHSRAGEHLLSKFVRRTTFLNPLWEGVYTDDKLDQLAALPTDVLFACLPAPNDLHDTPLLALLRQQSTLIACSSYPLQAYADCQLLPWTFLTEPFSFDMFEATLQDLIERK